MPKFNDRIALITGAAAGIGLATARHLDANGVRRLILVDRDGDAVNRQTFNCEVDAIVGDVSDPAFWTSIEPRLANLDHAVVNAGIASASPVAAMAFADWRRVMSVNLDGAFLTLQAAMRAMSQRGGSIVATASAAGLKAEAGTGAYGASKAALIHLVKIAAKEAAPQRIRVNAIAPGGVETAVWDAVPMFAVRAEQVGRDAAFAELASLATPLGRFAKPEEIATQIAFLLSDASALMTGSVLLTDGGYTL